MNDYAKLIAHAAAKFSGKPAVLSPLLDSYCGWENKKSRFSSEPTKGERIILSAGGLSFDELEISIILTPIKINEVTKLVEKDCAEVLLISILTGVPVLKQGHLKISMKHDSKMLGDNNFKWSRDCSYEFPISKDHSHFAPQYAAYWTYDDFLVIQSRYLENPFAGESGVRDECILKLIPTEVIDVLEPALNAPFLKQTLQAIKKKSTEVFSYVSRATEVPETNDVLSLLTSIPLKVDKKLAKDLEKLIANETGGQSSQEESAATGSEEPEKSPKKERKGSKSKKV